MKSPVDGIFVPTFKVKVKLTNVAELATVADDIYEPSVRREITTVVHYRHKVSVGDSDKWTRSGLVPSYHTPQKPEGVMDCSRACDQALIC